MQTHTVTNVHKDARLSRCFFVWRWSVRVATPRPACNTSLLQTMHHAAPVTSTFRNRARMCSFFTSSKTFTSTSTDIHPHFKLLAQLLLSNFLFTTTDNSFFVKTWCRIVKESLCSALMSACESNSQLLCSLLQQLRLAITTYEHASNVHG